MSTWFLSNKEFSAVRAMLMRGRGKGGGDSRASRARGFILRALRSHGGCGGEEAQTQGVGEMEREIGLKKEGDTEKK